MTNEERDQKIENILDTIRPNIQMDGGDIHFVKFQDGVVYVKLTGACIGCPASLYTLKLGVERLKGYQKLVFHHRLKTFQNLIINELLLF